MPRIQTITNNQQFYKEALNYLYYYNNVRKHSSLDGKTPFTTLQEQLPDIDTRIKVVPPIILDRVSVDLGPWSGYHLLAQYPKLIWVEFSLVRQRRILFKLHPFTSYLIRSLDICASDNDMFLQSAQTTILSLSHESPSGPSNAWT